jgi:hypothetical protein
LCFLHALCSLLLLSGCLWALCCLQNLNFLQMFSENGLLH